MAILATQCEKLLARREHPVVPTPERQALEDNRPRRQRAFN
jgi:hypothetical protein